MESKKLPSLTPSQTRQPRRQTQQIQIQTLDGKRIKIDVEEDWTVKRLKEEFGKWKGQGYDKVNLHYRAKRLKDDDLLSTYKIESDGFVLANIRSTGGFFI